MILNILCLVAIRVLHIFISIKTELFSVNNASDKEFFVLNLF
jgi:hypothetical protein